MRTDTRESLDWFRLLLQADPTLFRTEVDAYSVHLYSQERGPYDTVPSSAGATTARSSHATSRPTPEPSHPLWITELGWTTNPSEP